MSTVAEPLTDKQIALETLRRMPEAAPLQEIGQELALLAAIRRGEAAVEEGRVLTHEEVRRRSAAWTSR